MAVAFLVTTVAVSIFAPTFTQAQATATSCFRGTPRVVTYIDSLTGQQRQETKCVDNQGRVLDGFGNPIPGNVVDAQGNLRRAESKPINCSSGWRSYIHPVCVVRTLFSWIGAAFISIGVMIATAAGGIFEAAITYTIVELGTYLQHIKPVIDAGWTALRDIANIVIIGLFVFIAINIILGVQEFGEKKAVAKVLIVAVLINFSLLFTKIIVDASNFTAYQFYNSMVKGIDASQKSYVVGSGESAASLTGSGISAKFMEFLGAEGFADSSNKLSKIANNNQNAFYALGYGILSFIFLIGVAAVFLYGAFLIVSRAVLIVFLMLTSALAFASWLIPQQYVASRFRKWWESLLKAAFFAPILIAFLWMTLRVSDELSKALVTNGPGSGGTLGALAENASSQANAVALLNFILILGLLYASIMTANTFAKGISGFRFAQAGVGGAIFGSLAGASRLGGILGRNTIGWGGSAALNRLRSWYHRPSEVDESGRITRSREGRRTGIFGYVNRGILRGANYLATSRFDALQAKPVAAAVGGMGGIVAKSIVDQTKGLTKYDFRTMMEKRAQAADALARAIGPTSEQQNAIRQQIQQQINTQQQGMQQLIDTQQQTLRQVRAQERPGVEAAVRAGQAGRAAAERDVRTHEQRSSDMESNLRDVERRIDRARQDADAQGLADTPELQALMQQRTQLNAQAAQIRQDLQAARAGLGDLDRQARELAENQLDNNANVRRERDELLRRENELRAHRERTRTLADDVVRDQGVAFRQSLLWDRRARPFVAGEMRSQAGREALRAIAAEVQRTGALPTPAAPAAPRT